MRWTVDSNFTTPHSGRNLSENVGRYEPLKKPILMSGKERSKERVESFINELEQGPTTLTDEKFARLEGMIRERRGRAAAHVVVAQIDTAQPCNPRSSSKISFDLHVYM